jgi:DNA-binding CsgD family transcriptional regulator
MNQHTVMKSQGEARREREAAKATGTATPVTGKLSLGLTQREVARLMHISERAVRSIERRAIMKLRRHPLLKAIWREYSESKSWPEAPAPLTAQEVEALLNLATTWMERCLLYEVLSLVGQIPA